MSRILLVLAALTFFGPTLFGQETQTKPEMYSAVAMGTGGMVGGKSIRFNFHVNHFTTDEELDQFAQLLRDKGQDALRRALEKENVGRIFPTGGTGNQIAIARKRVVGTDTVITLVTARNMPFIELSGGGRSTTYPFGFLMVTLNEKGEGTGQIMVAAKIRFDQKQGQYQIESYGHQYIKAVNVRPEN